MSDDRNQPSSHIGSLESKIFEATTAPSEPVAGSFYYDTTLNKLCIYVNDTLQWKCATFSTTTSTSTSTSLTTTSTSLTTTSTSLTTTSTSKTTSTSTSITISTSTTTTL